MMMRAELDDHQAHICDAAHLGRAALARLRSDQRLQPEDRAVLDELGDAVAGLAEAAQGVLAELERTRIREDQARQDVQAAEESQAAVERARQALVLSRSRYAELADVALATLAAIAHGEDDPGAHLEHVLETHGHSPRLAKTLETRQVLADAAIWRRALEVA